VSIAAQLLNANRLWQPGMVTLVGVSITVAFFYSIAVTFGLRGKVFCWESATLIDIMLLGHWIEMKSAIGAWRALEKLSQLLPAAASPAPGQPY
jgi:Cu2+-exporting ATPase